MKIKTLDCIIPCPASMRASDGTLLIRNAKTYYIESPLAEFEFRLKEMGAYYGLNLDSGEKESADIIIFIDSNLGHDAWTIKITDSRVEINGGDKSGVLYALSAFSQMLAIAFCQGEIYAELDCGFIMDKPRFSWRGFMLDSARHFQRKETIKAVIRLMAYYRLNVFHWHLTDSSGWRFQSDTAPELDSWGTIDSGQYSKADLREIADYAAAHYIEIIPEIDVPGHSGRFLQVYPQYSCFPSESSHEFCLGNQEGREKIKNILLELFEIFPDSKYIHIGGDEACSDNWEKCPRCQQAMKDKNLTSVRELEHDFMLEISRFVSDHKRTPIVWGICSDLRYPKDTMIQAWLDFREPLRVKETGNKVIYSLHSSLYFDYPANLGEPYEPGMSELSEKAVYMTEPYVLWEDAVKDIILGTEACLWTERVPEWRIMQKIIPRLSAYSECAWSQMGNKQYNDFKRRKDALDAAGFNDFMRTLG